MHDSKHRKAQTVNIKINTVKTIELAERKNENTENDANEKNIVNAYDYPTPRPPPRIHEAPGMKENEGVIDQTEITLRDGESSASDDDKITITAGWTQ